MAIAQVGTTTKFNSASATTSASVTKPTGTAQDHVMVAFVHYDDTSNPTITPPTGWTSVITGEGGWSAAGTLRGVAAYIRVAGASEGTSYAWGFSASTMAQITLSSWSGVDSTTPQDVAAVLASGGSGPSAASTATMPAMTIATAGAMLIASVVNKGGNTTPAATITGMAALDGGQSGGTPFVNGATLTEVRAATGTTGTKTVTAGNSAGNGVEAVMLALRPGASSTPKTASDSMSFGESVAQSFGFGLTDGATFADASSSSQSFSVSEALSMSDVAVLARQNAIIANESLSLAEVSFLTQTFSVNEILSMTDVSSVLKSSSLAANDSFSFADVSSVAAALSLVDALTLTEAVSLAASAVVTDSAAFTDVSVGVGAQSQKTASDLFTSAELASVLTQLAVVASDTSTVAEASALSAAVAAIDSAVQTDLALLGSISNISVFDAHSLGSESATVLQLASIVGSESFSLSEISAVAASLSRTDALALSENGASVAAQTAKTAFDSLVLIAETTNSILAVLGSPSLLLPTRATIQMWASMVVLGASLTDAALNGSVNSADVVDKLTSVTLLTTTE